MGLFKEALHVWKTQAEKIIEKTYRTWCCLLPSRKDSERVEEDALIVSGIVTSSNEKSSWSPSAMMISHPRLKFWLLLRRPTTYGLKTLDTFLRQKIFATRLKIRLCSTSQNLSNASFCRSSVRYSFRDSLTFSRCSQNSKDSRMMSMAEVRWAFR